jgi:hypothetical protein
VALEDQEDRDDSYAYLDQNSLLVVVIHEVAAIIVEYFG